MRMYGEDFSCYAQKTPSRYIHLGFRNEEKDIIHMMHHSRFDIDEECLVYGVVMFLEFVGLSTKQSLSTTRASE